MGKLKISQDNKKKNGGKGNSGIPNWLLSAIVITVILAVLLTCVFSLLANSGLVMRSSMAMKSENYTVDGSMMAYYFVNTYSNFITEKGATMSYYSIGDSTPVTELRNYPFGGTAESTNAFDKTLGEFEGTWFDYIMSLTKQQVRETLIYCEAAKGYGIELTDEDKETINSAIDATILQFRINNGATSLTESACLNAMYGKGVKRTDIRKALELLTLASKASDKALSDINELIDANDGIKIDEEYAANSKDYDVVSYFFYRFNVSYEDVVADTLNKENPTDTEIKENEAKILEAYKAKIEATKKLAEELQGKTELADFQLYVYNYVANEGYAEIWDEVAPETTLAVEQVDTIKKKIVESVVAQVAEGKTSVTLDLVTEGEGDSATYKIFDITVDKTFAGDLNEFQNEMFDTVYGAKTSYTVEKANFVEDNEASEWAFAEGTKVGDKKVIEEGDGANAAEIAVKDEYFRSGVYVLTREAGPDLDKLRNIAYMTFSGTDTANKAIEALGKETNLTKESFEALANNSETGATDYTYVENYKKGDLSAATDFDSWLYDAETKAGSYTTTPVTMTDGTVLVVFYEGEGELGWRVSVKEALVEEASDAKMAEFTELYANKIEESSWTLSRVCK